MQVIQVKQETFLPFLRNIAHSSKIRHKKTPSLAVLTAIDGVASPSKKNPLYAF